MGDKEQQCCRVHKFIESRHRRGIGTSIFQLAPLAAPGSFAFSIPCCVAVLDIDVSVSLDLIKKEYKYNSIFYVVDHPSVALKFAPEAVSNF